MYLAFTSEQRDLHDAVRDVLSDTCPASLVRAVWTDGPRMADALWAQLTELGLPMAMVSETHGGLGLGFLDVVGAFEHVGYYAVPAPIVETVLAAPMLAAAGKRDLLDQIGAGQIQVALACDSASHIAFAQAQLAVIADASGVGVVTSDMWVTDSDSVDRTRPIARQRGDVQPMLLDLDQSASIRLTRQASVATSAQLVGLAARMVDMAVEYVKIRHQFGQPVGSFQALKHKLADAYLAVEFSRPLVHAAAWAVASDAPSADLDVATAKAAASQMAIDVARAALQSHGAIAYTIEHDFHFFSKRAYALASAYGDAVTQRARIAELLGLG